MSSYGLKNVQNGSIIVVSVPDEEHPEDMEIPGGYILGEFDEEGVFTPIPITTREEHLTNASAFLEAALESIARAAKK
jgi:hypothetical protein